ncbi:hypothetical protein O181_091696 [Austropuccinia psidii MF-1]|uniref:Uncharacterized protein n=1 Tax=Austropuccinia psidii MF-1 TaxID=1389203 RepID=A0A9Q3IXY6_9BASI|nr:hypothetical protein [Austropuccinia psidii MF-1]
MNSWNILKKFLQEEEIVKCSNGWNTILYKPKNKKTKEWHNKKGGNQGRSPGSFYQQASSQPTFPVRRREQEKKEEENISPKLKDPKNPKRCHRQNLHGIEGQRGTNNEANIFPKEIPCLLIF